MSELLPNTTRVKRLLFGRPFPTRDDIHERLDNVRALAIFASDPISSNAYATEAIMSVLLLLGAVALQWTLPLALGVALLVVIVVTSYIQTIYHYPDGGGAYTVTKDNLGTIPSLFAAAALLIDYVLTVAVSVSAGMRAVTSAFPALEHWIVPMAIGAIVILTWINLRGVRESGTVFAFPTYAFVGGVILMLGIGLARMAGIGTPLEPVAPDPSGQITATGLLLVWYLARAFAAGCTALTGIEAISNGVQAFKPPEAKHAAQTMVAMGAIAMTLFVGISFLATRLHLVPGEGETILSQLARTVAGDGLLYYWVQAFTMLILVLAANTGYQDFPRLSSYLARDGFLPRWMQNRGDRLVYNAGILILALLASLVVLAFRAEEIAMLPLYALGVMLSFTLSQTSMAVLMGRIAHLKPGERMRTNVTEIHYEANIGPKRLMNMVGALATGLVLIALTVTKFLEGAWIVILALPLLVLLFRSIKAHYATVAQALTTQGFKTADLRPIAEVAIVPIGDIHRGTLRALRYARRFSSNVRAVAISTSDATHARLEERWGAFPDLTEGIALHIIDYEYRDILTPLEEFIDGVVEKEYPGALVTVVIPQFVSESWAGDLLHNRTATLLRQRLLHRESLVIIDVPWQINRSNGTSV